MTTKVYDVSDWKSEKTEKIERKRSIFKWLCMGRTEVTEHDGTIRIQIETKNGDLRPKADIALRETLDPKAKGDHNIADANATCEYFLNKFVEVYRKTNAIKINGQYALPDQDRAIVFLVAILNHALLTKQGWILQPLLAG